MSQTFCKPEVQQNVLAEQSRRISGEKGKKKGDQKVTDYINSAQPPFKEVMLLIRKLIFELVPDAEEAIKWGTPVYSRIKNICYMAIFKKHVTLGFYDGRMLKDPDRLLEGTGKMMKHIKVKKIDDFDQEQIKKWILEGFYF